MSTGYYLDTSLLRPTEYIIDMHTLTVLIMCILCTFTAPVIMEDVFLKLGWSDGIKMKKQGLCILGTVSSRYHFGFWKRFWEQVWYPKTSKAFGVCLKTTHFDMKMHGQPYLITFHSVLSSTYTANYNSQHPIIRHAFTGMSSRNQEEFPPDTQ